MSNLKIKKADTFSIIPNAVLKNPELSMKAKGLLCYLLSLPNDWRIHKTELKNHFSDGKDAIYSAFDELIEAGYIYQETAERDNGKFTGNNYTVADLPQRFYRSGFTATENPPLLNTNRLNTDKQNIDNKLSIINADLLEIFNRWLVFKKAKRQTYKDDDSITTCYKKLIRLSNGEYDLANKIIEEAISNNWSGFFALKNQPEKLFEQTYDRPTMVQ